MCRAKQQHPTHDVDTIVLHMALFEKRDRTIKRVNNKALICHVLYLLYYVFIVCTHTLKKRLKQLQEIEAVETIHKHILNREKCVQRQKNIHYNSEYDRLAGELCETNIHYGKQHRIATKTLKHIYNDL